MLPGRIDILFGFQGVYRDSVRRCLITGEGDISGRRRIYTIVLHHEITAFIGIFKKILTLLNKVKAVWGGRDSGRGSE